MSRKHLSALEEELQETEEKAKALRATLKSREGRQLHELCSLLASRWRELPYEVQDDLETLYQRWKRS